MQNTMVGEGGGAITNKELGEKMKKGKEEGKEVTYYGEKGLKTASFLVVNHKNFRGGSPLP